MRKARVLVQAYNLLGCQALGIGPGDIQLGLDKLRELENEARFPFLCANLIDATTKKPLFRPHVVIEAGGVRFGFFSLLLDRLNPAYARRVIPGSEIVDPAAATAATIAELQPLADVIVLLSQLNMDANEALLAANPGIDVIGDAYARNGVKAIWVTAGEYVLDRGGKPIVRVDGQGSRVAVVEMTFPAGARKFSSYKAYDVALEPHYMGHPDMVNLVQALERGGKAPPAFEYDPGKLRLSEAFLGQEACGNCHDEQFRFWKATPHANTYANLEKTSEQWRADCVGCHSLGYGVAFASTRAIGDFKEVQCESCHGLKPGHAENPKLVRLGPVIEDTCWGCHNPQITMKEFNYAGVLKEVSCPKIAR